MASKRELPGRIGSVVYLPGFSNRYVRVADRTDDLPYPWCDSVSGLMSEDDLVEFFDEMRDEFGEWMDLRLRVTEEMVEAGARALVRHIFTIHGPDDPSDDLIAEHTVEPIREQARVVLEAVIGKEQGDDDNE